MKLGEWIRRLLTRKVVVRIGKRKTVNIENEEPEEKLVILTQFAMAAIIVLGAVEIAHVVVLGSWNSEVFSAITGLIGTVTGIIIGRKA